MPSLPIRVITTLLCATAATTGCMRGGPLVGHATRPHGDLERLTTQAIMIEARELDAADETVTHSATIDDALPVTTVSTSAVPQPTLLELPNDGDLTALIERTDGAVLLDFYADWCGPCRKQSQILHELKNIPTARETSIIKVNVDEHRQVAEQFHVTGLPTLVMIQDGRVIERRVGLAEKSELVAWLD